MSGFWKRLFLGLKRAPRLGEPPSERVLAILAEMKAQGRPCLRLGPGGDGNSRLGGSPEMAGEWPTYRGRPLSLIAQLDLAEMHEAGGPDWLPSEGRLLFFYELEHSGWGFDPKDAGCAVVRHEAGAGALAAEPADLPADMRFDEYPVIFSADVSLPSDERMDIDWAKLSGDDESDLEAAVEAMAPAEPAHQVGGYPGTVQSDGMELECQLVTHGLYLGKPSDYNNDRVDALKSGAADWRLLLQVDTDPKAGMLWGDAGRLYFWVREQDARAGDFSKTWTVLQSC